MRRAEIIIHKQLAGWLTENENGYNFVYNTDYLKSQNPEPVSLTMPLQVAPFTSKVLFPFFDGLIPEGWLLAIAEKNWKLNPRDKMGLLLACCKDCIGAVSVNYVNNEGL